MRISLGTIFLVTAVLVVLKLAQVIGVSWLLILSPLWLIPAIMLIATFIALLVVGIVFFIVSTVCFVLEMVLALFDDMLSH
jgi:hypothetical protein